MATFKVPLEVLAADSSCAERVDGIVDTGATYTVVPRDVLTRLGFAPAFQRRFRLADGTVTTLDMTQVPVRLEGQTLFTLCAFGDSGADPLLGAVTLEEFGLGVDPVNQKLIAVEGLLVGLRED